jgi:hypothetical protein
MIFLHKVIYKFLDYNRYEGGGSDVAGIPAAYAP